MIEQTLSLWRRLVSWRFRLRGRDETAARRVWLSRAPSGDAAEPAERWPAALTDASRAGVRLVVDREVNAGSVFRLEPEPTDAPGPRDLLLRVRETTPAGHGRWALECVFTRELADADLEAFGARRVGPTSRDYRAWMRFPCDVNASCRPVRTLRAPEWPARVENISAGGIGLVVRRTFEPGTVLSVELPGEPPRTVLACVVHATRQEDAWLLGCNFSTELTDDELRACGAKRQNGTADDYRAYVRFPCELEMACQRVPDPVPETVSVKVLNLSASGVGLVVPVPLAPGTLLNIDLPAAGRQRPLTVLACVVYVSPRDEGEWLVGCNFASELPEESLRAMVP